MGRADYLALGDWNCVCYECGRKRKASQMKKHWQGYWVCPEHWEPRQQQDFARAVGDNVTPPWTQPRPEVDTFLGFNVGAEFPAGDPYWENVILDENGAPTSGDGSGDAGEEVTIWDGNSELPATTSPDAMARLINYAISVTVPQLIGQKLSRWNVVRGHLTYVAALPATAWEDVGYSALSVTLSGAVDGETGTWALRRNNPAVASLEEKMAEQVFVWEDFRIAQTAKLAQVLAYTKVEELPSYAVVVVPPAAVPVMGVGAYATVTEYTAVGTVLTGDGDLVFDGGVVDAADSPQWVRLLKYFQRMRRVRKKVVTSYSIASIVPYSNPAYAVTFYDITYVTSENNCGGENAATTSGSIDSREIPDSYGLYALHRAAIQGAYALNASGCYGYTWSYGPLIYRLVYQIPSAIFSVTRTPGSSYTGAIYYDSIVQTGQTEFPAANGNNYHITRTKTYSYVVDDDPAYPTGGNYGISTFEAREETRDEVFIVSGVATITNSQGISTSYTLPSVAYTLPSYAGDVPHVTYYRTQAAITWGGTTSYLPWDATTRTYHGNVIGT